VDNAQPTQARKRVSFRTIGYAVLWLLLIIFLADAGTWLYPAWKKSRADSFASQAQDAFEGENFAEAEEQVAAALGMRPNDPRFLRLAARVYGAQLKPEATSYYLALLKTKDALDSDRFEFIDFAIDLKRPDLARPFLRENKAASPQELYYKARWQEASGDLAGALKTARAMVAADSTRVQYRFLLARILSQTRDAGGIEEAKKILIDIAANNYRDRPRAIRMLTKFPLSQRELLQFAKWLRDNPWLRAEDYFLSSDLLLGANTNALEPLTKEALSRYTNGVPLERAALGHWLNRHGLYGLTLTNISPNPKSPTITAVRLEALIATTNWNAALDLGKTAEAEGASEIARSVYRRLSTNSPVSAAAVDGLKRLKTSPKAVAQ